MDLVMDNSIEESLIDNDNMCRLCTRLNDNDRILLAATGECDHRENEILTCNVTGCIVLACKNFKCDE